MGKNKSMSKSMNKNKSFQFIVLLLLGIESVAFAQGIPTDFNIGSGKLSKTADRTPTGNSIDRILVQDKNTIWLGTGKGLSKTTDHGATWTNYFGTPNFKSESVSAVGYNNGTIWAATWHFEDYSGSSVPVGSGLRYSQDGGTTWTAIPQPVDAAGDSTIIYGANKLRALPVTAVQQNFIYEIAFTKNTIWIVSFSGGLRKSTDLGKTWQRVVLPPDNLSSIKPTDQLKFDLAPSSGKLGYTGNLNHRAFSIISIGDDTLYVGTAGGVNKSTDGGVSWTKFNHTNQAKPITGNFVLSLDRNDADGSIWAATWKAEGAAEYYGVSKSANGGQSWETFFTDENVRDLGFKYYGGTISEVFLVTEDGVYRSNNNGSTWLGQSNIIDFESRIEIKPTKFLSVEVNQIDNSTYDVWVGTNDGMIKTRETNAVGWNGKWKTFLATGKETTKSESFAFPNPFNPKFDVARIKYKIESSGSVTLRIFDFGMNLVRTVLQNASRIANAEQIDYWDGKDENGKVVPNGVYLYRLDIGSEDPLFGKIIVIL